MASESIQLTASHLECPALSGSSGYSPAGIRCHLQVATLAMMDTCQANFCVPQIFSSGLGYDGSSGMTRHNSGIVAAPTLFVAGNLGGEYEYLMPLPLGAGD